MFTISIYRPYLSFPYAQVEDLGPEVAVKEIAVNSRIIKKVYFGDDSGLLKLCFKNGKERVFSNVPKRDIDALIKSNSPGKYYIDFIRPRFERVGA
ncbi:KTSC domain-containing protein [Agrobacterium cavarae]|uniref:KTSC domain-containing protein n=1 Tax=Agrobacterium cavarae TaxID=2528239 RepID=UPI0028B12961|nr:KTSC domain-containing protein [Agrobacterium cavarae]